MKRERDFCHVADQFCKAPAGYGVGGGVASGTVMARCFCFQCGLPVCANCSTLRLVKGKRRRICNVCQTENGDEALVVKRLQRLAK